MENNSKPHRWQKMLTIKLIFCLSFTRPLFLFNTRSNLQQMPMLCREPWIPSFTFRSVWGRSFPEVKSCLNSEVQSRLHGVIFVIVSKDNNDKIIMSTFFGIPELHRHPPFPLIFIPHLLSNFNMHNTGSC